MLLRLKIARHGPHQDKICGHSPAAVDHRHVCRGENSELNGPLHLSRRGKLEGKRESMHAVEPTFSGKLRDQALLVKHYTDFAEHWAKQNDPQCIEWQRAAGGRALPISAELGNFFLKHVHKSKTFWTCGRALKKRGLTVLLGSVLPTRRHSTKLAKQLGSPGVPGRRRSLRPPRNGMPRSGSSCGTNMVSVKLMRRLMVSRCVLGGWW